MKKHIVEDLPARNYPQSSPQGQAKRPMSSGSSNQEGNRESGGEKTPEQRIRQAVYDIRYRARRENIPLRTAYSQYMQNSSMSEMEKAEVRRKLFGKEGGASGGGNDEGNKVQSENFKFVMKETASNSMAKALYKVFVDNHPKITEEYIEELRKEFTNDESSSADTGATRKKFKVRVTDPQSGVTYVRYANREKINQLRARGLEVEMTEYGDPYEGERGGNSQSKARMDYDHDGKIESGAKEHAGAVHNAIQRKKGGVPDGKDTSNVKESYLGEVLGMANLPILDNQENVNPDTNEMPIDVLPDGKKNRVTINPTNSLMAHNQLVGTAIIENGYSKFLNLLHEKKMTKAMKEKEKNLKRKYDKSSMKSNMENQYGVEGKRVYFAKIRKEAMKEDCGCDDTEKESKETKNLQRDSIEPRGMETASNLIKNKFRAMGAKKVVVTSDMD